MCVIYVCDLNNRKYQTTQSRVQTHSDANLGGVFHVLIADTIGPSSLIQTDSLAGYIIHYHNSDAPTQAGAAWIIKGRYISTCVEACVWADIINRLKALQNLSIHIKQLNALHQRTETIHKLERGDQLHLPLLNGSKTERSERRNWDIHCFE